MLSIPYYIYLLLSDTQQSHFCFIYYQIVFYFIPIVFNIYFVLFLYLAVPVLVVGSLRVEFSCGLWDLVPDQGSHSGPLHWEQCLSHWTTSSSPSIQY